VADRAYTGIGQAAF